MVDVLVLLDGFGVLPTDTVRTILNKLLVGCNNKKKTNKENKLFIHRNGAFIMKKGGRGTGYS